MILLGAGEFYVMKYEGAADAELPTDDKIEVPANHIGHTQGGATVDYKPTKYDVVNSYGRVVKSFITEEALSIKTGLLEWNMKNIELLSTAVYTEGDAATQTKPKEDKLVFGGSQSAALTNILVRFVHEKEDGLKLRFTMIGNAGNGFTINFNDKETIVDAEITAIEFKKNFLAEFREEMVAATGS